MAKLHTAHQYGHPAIGETFGRLTVIGVAPDREQGDRRLKFVHCRCQCGQEREVRVNGLRTGNSTSCGCLQRENFKYPRKSAIGERYGHVTVIADADDRIQPNGQHRRIVMACCDCGTVFKRMLVNLRKRGTTTCGGCVPRGTHRMSGTPTRPPNKAGE